MPSPGSPDAPRFSRDLDGFLSFFRTTAHYALHVGGDNRTAIAFSIRYAAPHSLTWKYVHCLAATASPSFLQFVLEVAYDCGGLEEPRPSPSDFVLLLAPGGATQLSPRRSPPSSNVPEMQPIVSSPHVYSTQTSPPSSPVHRKVAPTSRTDPDTRLYDSEFQPSAPPASPSVVESVPRPEERVDHPRVPSTESFDEDYGLASCFYPEEEFPELVTIKRLLTDPEALMQYLLVLMGKRSLDGEAITRCIYLVDEMKKHEGDQEALVRVIVRFLEDCTCWKLAEESKALATIPEVTVEQPEPSSFESESFDSPRRPSSPSVSSFESSLEAELPTSLWQEVASVSPASDVRLSNSRSTFVPSPPSPDPEVLDRDPRAQTPEAIVQELLAAFENHGDDESALDDILSQYFDDASLSESDDETEAMIPRSEVTVNQPEYRTPEPSPADFDAFDARPQSSPLSALCPRSLFEPELSFSLSRESLVFPPTSDAQLSASPSMTSELSEPDLASVAQTPEIVAQEVSLVFEEDRTVDEILDDPPSQVLETASHSESDEETNVLVPASKETSEPLELGTSRSVPFDFDFFDLSIQFSAPVVPPVEIPFEPESTSFALQDEFAFLPILAIQLFAAPLAASSPIESPEPSEPDRADESQTLETPVEELLIVLEDHGFEGDFSDDLVAPASGRTAQQLDEQSWSCLLSSDPSSSTCLSFECLVPESSPLDLDVFVPREESLVLAASTSSSFFENELSPSSQEIPRAWPPSDVQPSTTLSTISSLVSSPSPSSSPVGLASPSPLVIEIPESPSSSPRPVPLDVVDMSTRVPDVPDPPASVDLDTPANPLSSTRQYSPPTVSETPRLHHPKLPERFSPRSTISLGLRHSIRSPSVVNPRAVVTLRIDPPPDPPDFETISADLPSTREDRVSPPTSCSTPPRTSTLFDLKKPVNIEEIPVETPSTPSPTIQPRHECSPGILSQTFGTSFSTDPRLVPPSLGHLGRFGREYPENCDTESTSRLRTFDSLVHLSFPRRPPELEPPTDPDPATSRPEEDLAIDGVQSLAKRPKEFNPQTSHLGFHPSPASSLRPESSFPIDSVLWQDYPSFSKPFRPPDPRYPA